MATSTDDLEQLEADVAERLAEEAGAVEADVEAAGQAAETEEQIEPPSLRIAVAVTFPVLAAAVMAGGVFIGVAPRFYAAVAGLLGIALAFGVSRVRRPTATNALIAVGLFAIGAVMVIPDGFGNVTSIQSLASEAAKSGNVLRPPVEFTTGWQAILGWLMGCVGFVAAWVALAMRRPALALLVPLPVAAIAGISVPKGDQVASGIAVLGLFAVGLGLLSGAQVLGDQEERPPLAYEVRRAIKSVPFIAAITVALYFLAQTDFLFPKPQIDPTQKPQRPRTTPLSEVEDRVLFEVESSVTGPWRIGNLDVYDGRDWRLPPFADNRLKTVGRDGVVNKELEPGVKARFTVAGLTGAVLPGLPNMVGIVAEGPRLAYDSRNANIRTAQGQVQAGLSYTVTAAALPSVDDLRNDTTPLPSSVRRFTRVPAPPPAVVDLLEQARAVGPDRWTQFDFARSYVLDNVVASGVGTPKSIPPERVQEILASQRKEASPYEIVAIQALLARWLGLPSRIGYGFDGGDQVGGKIQVRPKNGATFVEVFFPNYEWLPVIGTPKQAKPSVNNDPSQQQFDPTVLPSNEIAVQLFVPTVLAPESIFVKQLQRALLIGIPLILFLALLYVVWPGVRKLWLRTHRRSAAEAMGPRAQVALAYAEWRDYANDVGYRFPNDTPLMYLDRFVDDDEHTELAWLVTRTLWGDLQHSITAEVVASANELSRSLRRRLAQSQPATVRAVALVSRLSLRDPFAPDLNRLLTGKEDDRASTRAA